MSGNYLRIAPVDDDERSIAVSRRDFLKAGVAGGGFVLGFSLPAFALGATAGKPAGFERSRV